MSKFELILDRVKLMPGATFMDKYSAYCQEVRNHIETFPENSRERTALKKFYEECLAGRLLQFELHFDIDLLPPVSAASLAA